MRFFGGLSVEETAEVLKVSPVTVNARLEHSVANLRGREVGYHRVSMSVHFEPSVPKFDFRLQSLTFSDGSVLLLEQGTTLIITGPNNSGKSVTLRDIEQHLQYLGTDPNQHPQLFAVTDVAFQCSGTPISWQTG